MLRAEKRSKRNSIANRVPVSVTGWHWSKLEACVHERPTSLLQTPKHVLFYQQDIWSTLTQVIIIRRMLCNNITIKLWGFFINMTIWCCSSLSGSPLFSLSFAQLPTCFTLLWPAFMLLVLSNRLSGIEGRPDLTFLWNISSIGEA